MWWYIMIMILIIFALYGRINYISNYIKFLFEVRLESEHPKFGVTIFEIYRNKL